VQNFKYYTEAQSPQRPFGYKERKQSQAARSVDWFAELSFTVQTQPDMQAGFAGLAHREL